MDGGSARDGDYCLHDYLESPLTTVPTYGDSNGDGIDDIDGGPWLDNDGDMCGDIASNTQVIKELQTIRFTCADQDEDGYADIAVCSSWDNNAGTACTALADAYPGTNSKCSCGLVNLPFAPTSVTMTGASAGSFTAGQAVGTSVGVVLLALFTLAFFRRRRRDEAEG